MWHGRWDDEVFTGRDRDGGVRAILEHELDRTAGHHQTPPHAIGDAVRSQEAGRHRAVVEDVGRANEHDVFGEGVDGGHSEQP